MLFGKASSANSGPLNCSSPSWQPSWTPHQRNLPPLAKCLQPSPSAWFTSSAPKCGPLEHFKGSVDSSFLSIVYALLQDLSGSMSHLAFLLEYHPIHCTQDKLSLCSTNLKKLLLFSQRYPHQPALGPQMRSSEGNSGSGGVNVASVDHPTICYLVLYPPEKPSNTFVNWAILTQFIFF